MGVVGRGHIVTEERVEYCGVRVVWHVVMFTDDALRDGTREREVGRSMDASHADAIKARWEKETCAKFADAPVKYTANGVNGSKTRKKPAGRDPRASRLVANGAMRG